MWKADLFYQESGGFKVSHACVAVAVEQCRKCVRISERLILPAKQRVNASGQCYQAACMSGQASLLGESVNALHLCPFKARTIREDYQ